MKRNELFASTLVLAVALGTGSALRATDPVMQCPACSLKDTAKTASGKATKEKVVQELIEILNETRSHDTFVVTVSALGMMGPDAQSAVPCIIRNADRLGLLKGISEIVGEEASEDAKPSKQQRIAEGIMDCLDQILSKEPGNSGKPTSNMNAPLPLIGPPAAIVLPECLPFPRSAVSPPPPPPHTGPLELDFNLPLHKISGQAKPPQAYGFFIGFVR